MDKSKLVSDLRNLYSNELLNPFPYRDTDRIQAMYKHEFSLIPNEIFNADFNDYCMTITGTISYVLNGHEDDIPLRQINLLKMNFFERFTKYIFLEMNIAQFSIFNTEYKSYEKARKLLLEILEL
ncbi:hypothetical protein BC351_11710 [Paenibacillus ferrarius]|uniref:YxiJ-like protein n=2 Tax=Paenibacillus ferrarius TaxID=1469647 RepID=A0A1V4H840_9BACL|nr:hypothetical protein BC351_11710 [Paenibacillus ferrarius]